jgi:hypothetical protein
MQCDADCDALQLEKEADVWQSLTVLVREFRGIRTLLSIPDQVSHSSSAPRAVQLDHDHDLAPEDN